MSSPISRASIGIDRVDHLVQVEHRRLEHLLAREREQLARQLRRALGRVVDLGDLLRARPGADPVPGDAAVARDHGQQVVEVVRDAARELPDGFHLLCLAQPALGLQRAQLRVLPTRELVADRRDEGVDVVAERSDLRRP